MILLSFTVRNHASIRDEVTLDLVRPSLRTLQPKDGQWGNAVFPVAGIFGGNATGKSALLDALTFCFVAIRDSASVWQGFKNMVRKPFLLDGTHETTSSAYELDFVVKGRRHQYGFEIDAQGISREWLSDIPSTRWRSLFQRDRNAGALRFHPSMKPMGEITNRELVLSRALLLGHPQLSAIAHDLTSHFDTVLVKDSHREARLADIAESLAEGSISFSDLLALLQVADIGVTDIRLEERKVPAHILRAFERFQRELEGDAMEEETELDAEGYQAVARNLLFKHRGSIEDPPELSLQDESDGTIAWLALAAPALSALRRGGLLTIDEIDASIHPHLLDLLIGAFSDPDINRHHAQLIFTSHESFVLSPLSDTKLVPEQVWFTDKTTHGVTELTCLADFPRHPDANVAKRYLNGRYGGTPRLSPSLFAALVSTAHMDIEHDTQDPQTA